MADAGSASKIATQITGNAAARSYLTDVVFSSAPPLSWV